ncbi:MAG: rhodanese-like domain-containing protein [Acidiferrobacterales bacterium]|nr:rhodanese-like domain-containing protein [Acidiferrobacterales bacterium]
MKNKAILLSTLLTFTLSAPSAFAADAKPVGITPDMMSVSVTHNGAKTEIVRNQDNGNTVIDAFAKTSRPCPPFCIQPMTLAEGVETLGELELIDYVKKMEAGDKNIMLIDSRTPDWVAKGTIPGAVNISWTELTPAKGATTEGITKVMTEDFNVGLASGADEIAIDEAIANGTVSEVFDYGNAKTLVLFCNGMWCGQSPASIRTLLKFGYPAENIKWYRDGMQAWEILGFSTVKP